MKEQDMTDCELLEFAAKAAGIDWFDEPAAKQGRGLHLKSGRFWNPPHRRRRRATAGCNSWHRHRMACRWAGCCVSTRKRKRVLLYSV